MDIRERLRRWLWRFAVKHCRPAALDYSQPQLVFCHGDATWRFILHKGKALVAFSNKAEAVNLNNFLVDSLHFLSEHPEACEPTIYEQAASKIRGVREDIC